ncbi:hypothetical protein [Frateuria aurantia]|nr:hypothetical protein [Frateuria aurantia]
MRGGLTDVEETMGGTTETQRNLWLSGMATRYVPSCVVTQGASALHAVSYGVVRGVLPPGQLPAASSGLRHVMTVSAPAERYRLANGVHCLGGTVVRREMHGVTSAYVQQLEGGFPASCLGGR